MENRQQVEDRVHFSKEIKEKVLLKTNCKCGHCGKLLNNRKDYTIDHAVPLAKGGTSDYENLVALCRKCNEIKDNSVVQIKNYYKFVSKEDLKVLETYFDNYCKNMNWITINNAFVSDNISFEVEYAVGYKKPIIQKKVVEFIKATDDDFEDICSFLEYYEKSYGKNGELFEKGAEKYLNDMWYNSGIYYMLDSKGTISLVILINPIAIDVAKERGGDTAYINYCFGSSVFLNPDISISNKGYNYLKDYMLQCIMYFMNKCADSPSLDVIFDSIILYSKEDYRITRLLQWYFDKFEEEVFDEYLVFHLECFGEEFSRGGDKRVKERYRENYQQFKKNGQLYLRDVLRACDLWEERFDNIPCVCESEHFCKNSKFAKDLELLKESKDFSRDIVG